ncbi:MAG: 50S ribosomal protein L11 methyltransferase [Proteobacteria bacterium]|nr:50S ribosomal protein L11 methyltransferase [Pseudomonadota bacterium]
MDIRWMEIKVEFTGPEPETVQDLLARCFADHGIQGVVLDEPGATGLAEETEGDADGPLSCDRFAVTGYLARTPGADRTAEALAADVEDLCRRLSATSVLSTSMRLEEEWEHAWKTHFHPVEISPRILVQPSWEPVSDPGGRIVITLDPGMAFGTGTHPTTALCMRMIEDHMPPGCRFLDVGTGSGILLILAAKLGVGSLAGTDFDPVALCAAAKNLVANGVEKSRFTLWQGDLLHGIKEKSFDCVAANITAEPVARLLETLPRVLSPGGLFFSSGIITEKWPMVAGRLAAGGFSVLETRESGGWVGVAAVLRS